MRGRREKTNNGNAIGLHVRQMSMSSNVVSTDNTQVKLTGKTIKLKANL